MVVGPIIAENQLVVLDHVVFCSISNIVFLFKEIECKKRRLRRLLLSPVKDKIFYCFAVLSCYTIVVGTRILFHFFVASNKIDNGRRLWSLCEARDVDGVRQLLADNPSDTSLDLWFGSGSKIVFP